MLVLGLAALGGAGFALVRARPRPAAREATALVPPVAEPEPGSPSLEEELEELIAESTVRTQSDVDDAERPGPRVPAGTAR